MDKWTVVHVDNEIFPSAKRKWAIKPGKDMEEMEIPISKWKNPIWKCYIPYDFNYIQLYIQLYCTGTWYKDPQLPGGREAWIVRV